MPPETSQQARPPQRRPRDRDKERFSKLALASMAFLFINLLVWTSLRFREVIISSGLSTVCGLAGFIFGVVALKRIHRRHGRLQGESVAMLGKWLNLAIFVLSALLFVYSVSVALMRGQLLN